MMLFNSPEMEQMYSIFLYSKWNKCPRVLELDRLEGVEHWRKGNYNANPSFLHEYDALSYPVLPEERFTGTELGSILRSDYYFCSTDFIADYLARNLKVSNYILNSVGVPINEFVAEVKDLQFREFRHRKHFAFLGSLNSPKNVVMIDSLIKQLWPLIRKELKDAELHIYGSGYNKSLQGRKKEMEKNGIFLRGFLEETEELQKYRAVLYPVQHACGGKGAISEAWFHHTPVVTTPIGAEGYFH
jgi:O-antigen biosynthesis protein